MDPETLTFGYCIAGCINGAQESLWIEGTVERGEVRFETTVRSPEEPLLWDEQILALAAIAPVVLMSLDLEALHRGTAPETFRVESGIYDEGQRAVGRFVLAGYWSVEGARIELRAQLVEGSLNFEPMERVTHVGKTSPMSLLLAGDGSVVATKTWTLETSRGNSYSGVSVCRGRWLTVPQDAGCKIFALSWSESTCTLAAKEWSFRVNR